MEVEEITTIDCQYTRPRYAASYLVSDSGRALFIDNNTSHSVPLLLSALQKRGLAPEQVDYVIITHVHLDHAGGSSALMEACPRATLLCHPRAFKHITEPSRLVASAEAVYGKEAFAKMYGKISPIPAERVRIMEDEAVLSFGSKTLKFLHTRGHANHHFCIQLSDPSKNVIFTGDAFGLAYPDLQKNGLFIFASTSPTDFDAIEAEKSVRKIIQTRATHAYPTHFGVINDLPAAGSQLSRFIEFSQKLLDTAKNSSLQNEELAPFCEAKIRIHLKDLLAARSLRLEGEVEELLHLDIELNAQGLAHVATKLRSA